MENIYTVWKQFWSLQTELDNAISQNSKRASVSSNAALLLTALFEYDGLKINANEYLYNELCEKGLIIKSADGVKLTAKGAILAKSFSETLKKY